MFKNIFNFLVYICCGNREEEPKQTNKNIVRQEYDELVEFLKRENKKLKLLKTSSACC